MKTSNQLIKDSIDKTELKKSLGTELKKLEELPGSEKLKKGYKKQLFKEIIQDADYPELVEKDKKMRLEKRERAIEHEFKDALIANKSFDVAANLWSKNQEVLKRRLGKDNQGVFSYILSNWNHKYKFSKENLLKVQKSFNISENDFNKGIDYLACIFVRGGLGLSLDFLKEFPDLKKSPTVISAFKEEIIDSLSNGNMISDIEKFSAKQVIVDIDEFLKSKRVQDLVKKNVLSQMSSCGNYGCFDNLSTLNSVFGLEKSFRESVEMQEAYKKGILAYYRAVCMLKGCMNC